MLMAVAFVRSIIINISGDVCRIAIAHTKLGIGSIIGGLLLIQIVIIIPLAHSNFDKTIPIICLWLLVLTWSTWWQMECSSRWIWGQDILAHATQQRRLARLFSASEFFVSWWSNPPMKLQWFHRFDFLLFRFATLLIAIRVAYAGSIMTVITNKWSSDSKDLIIASSKNNIIII